MWCRDPWSLWSCQTSNIQILLENLCINIGKVKTEISLLRLVSCGAPWAGKKPVSFMKSWNSCFNFVMWKANTKIQTQVLVLQAPRHVSSYLCVIRCCVCTFGKMGLPLVPPPWNQEGGKQAVPQAVHLLADIHVHLSILLGTACHQGCRLCLQKHGGQQSECPCCVCTTLPAAPGVR